MSSDSSSVEFALVPSRPDVGEWYQVEVFFKDTGPYAFMWNSEKAWRAHGLGALTLEGVAHQYAEAKEVYAQVRIKKTVSSIITEGDK